MLMIAMEPIFSALCVVLCLAAFYCENVDLNLPTKLRIAPRVHDYNDQKLELALLK